MGERVSPLTNYANTANAGIATARAQLVQHERAAATIAQCIGPEVEAAHAAAYDLAVTDGSFSEHAGASLEKAGITDLAEYAAPFRLAADMPPGAGVPRLGLRIAPKFLDTYRGDVYADGFQEGVRGSGKVLHYPGTSFMNAFGVNLPLLVDPTEYDLDSFRDLPPEAKEGYAQQVLDGWNLIAEGHPEEPVYRSPARVIRAIGLLPVAGAVTSGELLPYRYDFAPTLLPPTDARRAESKYAVDAQLLLSGDTNPGGRVLEFNTAGAEPVLASREGRAVPLQITAARQVDTSAEALLTDPTRTARSQGALALYAYPRRVVYNYQTVSSAPEPGHMMSDYGSRAAIGGAHVDLAPASGYSSVANKQAGPLIGEFAASHDLPTVFSLQLFTVGKVEYFKPV